MAHLMAIDGSNLVNRAYHVTAPAAPGESEEAAHARRLAVMCDRVRTMLAGLIRRWSPSHLVVALDSPGPGWRDEAIAEFNGAAARFNADGGPEVPGWPRQMYPTYKGTRERSGPSTGEMIEAVRPRLAEWGLAVTESPGYEADDVLAALAWACTGRGSRISIVSRDKDLLQLVAPPLVRVLWPVGGEEGGEEACGWNEVLARLGVWPYQVADWLALVGDKGDNIPRVAAPKKTAAGVKMFGFDPKKPRAAELIAAYGDLDEIYRALPQLPAKEREWLEYSREWAYLSRRLAMVRTDAPFTLDAASTSLRRSVFARSLAA